MAKSYLQRNTRQNARIPFLADPLLDDFQADTDGGVPRVTIDDHGRLIRRRQVDEAARSNTQDGENNNHSENDDKLIDAAESFWNQYSQSKYKQPNTTRRNVQPSRARLRIDQHPPPPRAPLHQLQTQQFISEQMERDTRSAIEQALERYRQQDTNDNESRVYELIPIPIIHREEVNEHNRWFHRFRPRNNVNLPPHHDNQFGIPNHPPHQPRHDVRLAFRRICLAVLTVVAAFLCTIFQDAPFFLEDTIDADSIWFTGLLGPHSQGLPIQRPTAGGARRRWDSHNIHHLWKEDDGGFVVSEEEISRIEMLLNHLVEDEEKELANDDVGSCQDGDDGSVSCNALNE